MDAPQQDLSRLFARRAGVESVPARLVGRERMRDRFFPLLSNRNPPPPGETMRSNRALRDFLVGSAIGTVVGTAIGALLELALAVSNVQLFAASPLIAPLAMLGWGAGVGALLGAAAGPSKKLRMLATRFRHALTGSGRAQQAEANHLHAARAESRVG